MAFINPSPLPTSQSTIGAQTCKIWRQALPPRNGRGCTLGKITTKQSSVRTKMSSVSPMPESFEAACEEAKNAMTAALSSGQRKLFVEMDTTNGDATYTQLKTTTPTVLALIDAFVDQSIQIVFPDAGAAALARNEWGGKPETVTIVGLEQYETNDENAAVMFVVPRASEVDKLAAIMKNMGDTPVIIVNPDLIDMGVTGLSLNARKLREEVIDLFQTAYFLRVYPWGVLFRKYPEDWKVWIDDPTEASGFRCIASLKAKPSSDTLDELFQAELNALDDDSVEKPGPFKRAITGFQRFLSVYTKG